MSGLLKFAAAFAVALAVVVPPVPVADHSAAPGSYVTADLSAPAFQHYFSVQSEWSRSPVKSQDQKQRAGFQRFACVQLPTKCTSNSDCSCSSCCGQWSGTSGICQPSC